MNRPLALALTLATGFLFGSCARDDAIPSDLLGRWAARDGRHAGLAFEVRCTTVLLQQTRGFEVFRIAGLHVDSSGPEVNYDIDVYLPGGGVDRLHLVRPAVHSDTLFMGRLRQRWVRDRQAPVPWTAIDVHACPSPGAQGRTPGPKPASGERLTRRARLPSRR